MTGRRQQATALAWFGAVSLAPIVFLAMLWLAGDSVGEPGKRLLGAALYATQVSSLAWVAARVARSCVGPSGAVEVVLASAVVFLTVPAVVVMALGALGLLTLPAVVIGTSFVQLALSGLLARDFGYGETTPARHPLSVAEWFVVSLCVMAYLIRVLNAVRYTETNTDELTYYLPIIAEWIRNQSTAPGPEILMAHRGYPAMREAILTWLTLPLRSENLALLGLVELPLTYAAVYGLCRAFGAPRLLALAIAGVFVTTPAVSVRAIGQGNDLFVTLMFGLSSFFLIRVTKTRRTGDAVLAGLACGMLAGAKFTGPAYVVLLLATYLLSTVAPALANKEVSREHLYRVALHGLSAAGIAVLISAPWYLRNLIYLDNPFYPARVALMGHTLFDGPLDPAWVKGTVVGPNVLRLVPHWREFLQAFGLAFPVLIAAPVGLVITGLLHRTDNAWPRLLWLVLLPVAVFVLYLSQPFGLRTGDTSSFVSFYPRYLMVCILTLLPAAGALFASSGLLATGGAALAAGATVANLAAWTHYWWLAVVLAGAASVAGSLLGRHTWAIRPRPRPAVSALSLVLTLAVGTAAIARVDAFREVQKRDPDYGYPHVKPKGGMWDYVSQHVSHSAILCLGSSETFPLYGPMFTNRLVYLEQRDIEDLKRRVFGPRFGNLYIPDSVDILRLIEERRIDYIVGFPVVLDRRGPKGDVWDFGPAPTAGLPERFPDRFERIYTHEGSELLKVKK